MIRDPFFNDIIEKLNGVLDPELFEQCAADLLRHFHPTLVPIQGGTDAGMDGGVAEGEGPAFPLICTTASYVIGNLTRSIKSYLKNGGTRRRAILATSRQLTPPRRRNLEARANELGFELMQIYDQPAIADRLYYNPHWCLELLNLTGDPSPLSIIPLTKRPSPAVSLTGRDKDMKWLQKVKDDCLIVGQPGSGKTYLLRMFAKESEGLFVIKNDCAVIAPALRKQQPKILFVDDAHLTGNFLVKLRQMRDEVKASFHIVATCWPGSQDKIAEMLSISTSQVHTIDLLTRDEIVEIIKMTGVHGPRELVREIVDQSQGRPGLAVTLTYLCLQGDVQKVALGDALSKSTLNDFEPLVGKKARLVLAAFSIGGDSGMPMAIVAEALEIRESEIHIIITELAAGGVIDENERLQTISVTPRTLRFALVRDTFYRCAASLDASRLIENTPNLGDTVMTLIGARARGAVIPSDFIIGLLERANSEEAWHTYAWSGEQEAATVLDRHPELLIKVARAALRNTPKKVIPLLLNAAIGDDRELHSTTEHPLRLIDDWVKSSYPGTGAVMFRRETLLAVILESLSKGTDQRVCLKAMSSVFSLRYEDHSSDPGSGRTITLTDGAIAVSDVESIGGLWKRAFSAIKKTKDVDWSLVLNIISKVAFPGPIRGSVEPDFRKTARKITSRMVKDIAAVTKSRMGICRRLKGISQRAQLKVAISLDKDFETLFPREGFKDWEAVQKKWKSAIVNLANKWLSDSTDYIIKRIACFESEAESANINPPRLTPNLCWELSEKTSDRIPWIKAMIKAKLKGDLIFPFIQKSAIHNESGWKSIIARCLNIKDYRWIAIQILLTLPSPPQYLLNKAMQNLEGFGEFIEFLCFGGKVPEKTMSQLLKHPDKLIAGYTAVGEWTSDPKGEVRDSLRNGWRRAIINFEKEEYWIGEILSKDSSLAYEWLKKHINRDQIPYGEVDIIKKAIEPLGFDERKELLNLIHYDCWRPEIVNELIGDSVELYRVLLKDKKKKPFHLTPLSRFKSSVIGEESWEEEKWIENAKAALDAGYSPEDIVFAVLSSWSWSGKESDMWSHWKGRYENLCSNGDKRIQKVGEIGKARCVRNMKRALEDERREDVFGL